MIIKVSPYQRGLLLDHFSSKMLSPAEIETRFCRSMSAVELNQYVTSLDFDKEYLIGDYNEDLGVPSIDGFGHLILSDTVAELGLTAVKGTGSDSSYEQILEVVFEILENYWRKSPPKTLLISTNQPGKVMKLLKEFNPKKVKAVGIPKVRFSNGRPVELIQVGLNQSKQS